MKDKIIAIERRSVILDSNQNFVIKLYDCGCGCIGLDGLRCDDNGDVSCLASLDNDDDDELLLILLRGERSD